MKNQIHIAKILETKKQLHLIQKQFQNILYCKSPQPRSSTPTIKTLTSSQINSRIQTSPCEKSTTPIRFYKLLLSPNQPKKSSRSTSVNNILKKHKNKFYKTSEKMICMFPPALKSMIPKVNRKIII